MKKIILFWACIYLFACSNSFGQTIKIMSNDPSVDGANIYQGSTGNLIYSFSIQISDQPVILKSLKLHSSSVHTDIINYRLFYNTKNSMTGAKSLLPNVIPLSDTLIKFNLVAGEVLAPNNNSYYFFVLADIAAKGTSVAGHSIQIKKINFDDFNLLSVNPHIYHSCETYDGGVQTITQQVVSIADNGSQISAGSFVTNSLKNQIYRFTISPKGKDVNVQAIGFTTSGDYQDINKYQLWYGNSSDFSAASLIDSIATVPPGQDLFSFTAVKKNIINNSIGYFWITADIGDGVIAGDKFFIKAILPANITSDRANYTSTLKDGGIQTITAPTITIADNGTQIGPQSLVLKSLNNTIYIFTVSPTKGDMVLKGIKFETIGSISGNDITKYQLWYSDSNNFKSASVIGAVSGTVKSPNHQFNIFQSKRITNNKTGFFWITADVANKAKLDDIFSVRALNENDLTSSYSNLECKTTDGGYQTISGPAVRDSEYITFLNGANFDFSSNISGSYIAEFNVFDANLFKDTKNHRWGMGFGIQKINYTSGNINGNDSSNVVYSAQNFLLNPLQRIIVNNQEMIDSGASYIQQYRKFTSDSKNTVWSVFAQPTFRLHRHQINDLPNEGIYVHAYFEFLLNQWTKNEFVKTQYQDSVATETPKMVSASGFYWVPNDTITSNYNFISGYFGLGLSIFEHIGNDTTSHFYGQFTSGIALRTPNFLYLLNSIPEENGELLTNLAIKQKAKAFYLVKAEFSKNISKSQLVIGSIFRGNFPIQTGQYAVYVGLNLDLNSVFNAL